MHIRIEGSPVVYAESVAISAADHAGPIISAEPFI
jgi:hypothetical protein